MSTVRFSVGGMTCAACSAHVEKAASSVAGVKSASVNLLTNSMDIEFDGNDVSGAVCDAVAAAGYTATPADDATEQAPAGGMRKERALLEDHETPQMLRRLVASLVLLLPLIYVSMGHMMWGWPLPLSFSSDYVAIALYEMMLAAAVMVINQHFFISGFKSLVRGAPNMDTLVALGSGASFVYSTAVLFLMTGSGRNAGAYIHDLYFESSAMILTLITVGKTLEAYSKGKTTDAIKRLMDLAPQTAHVMRGGKESDIPAEQLRAGDMFVVRPGELIPADGTVVSGASTADESALTGESIPVDKAAGSAVSAATINQNGALVCTAVKVGRDTTLSRIISLVESAAASKAPASKLADKVSAVFVPSVIVLSVITCIVWLASGKAFGFALARAVSVLVISCPCALGLATPVAIMVGSGLGARHGILFKTAAALESTGKTQIAVLDKTGTVTEGKPVVTDIIPASGVPARRLLAAAASLEAQSEHPLSRAVAARAVADGITWKPVAQFTALPGSGVQGMLPASCIDAEQDVYAYGGNAAFIEVHAPVPGSVREAGERLASEGKTPLYFAAGGSVLGVIAVADTARADSAAAVAGLHDLGIETVMLTGDNLRTAEAIARRTGITHVAADMRPGGKEAAVAELGKYGKTAMVGDGINDAPALTRADTGIAIGAGSDVALDAADVVLMKSSLADAAAAVRLSRQVLRNIRENLFWAFCYNVIGIPVAAGALIPAFGIQLNPMMGAAAMSLSSFCVVTNALRLNLFDVYKAGKSRAHACVRIPDDLFHGCTGSDKKSCSMEAKGMKKTISIDGMMCDHCRMHVEKALVAVDGVAKADVSLADKNAVVTLDKDVSDKVLSDAVTAAGYTPVSVKTL